MSAAKLSSTLAVSGQCTRILAEMGTEVSEPRRLRLFRPPEEACDFLLAGCAARAGRRVWRRGQLPQSWSRGAEGSRGSRGAEGSCGSRGAEVGAGGQAEAAAGGAWREAADAVQVDSGTEPAQSRPSRPEWRFSAAGPASEEPAGDARSTPSRLLPSGA